MLAAVKEASQRALGTLRTSVLAGILISLGAAVAAAAPLDPEAPPAAPRQSAEGALQEAAAAIEAGALQDARTTLDEVASELDELAAPGSALSYHLLSARLAARNGDDDSVRAHHARALELAAGLASDPAAGSPGLEVAVRMEVCRWELDRGDDAAPCLWEAVDAAVRARQSALAATPVQELVAITAPLGAEPLAELVERVDERLGELDTWRLAPVTRPEGVALLLGELTGQQLQAGDTPAARRSTGLALLTDLALWDGREPVAAERVGRAFSALAWFALQDARPELAALALDDADEALGGHLHWMGQAARLADRGDEAGARELLETGASRAEQDMELFSSQLLRIAAGDLDPDKPPFSRLLLGRAVVGGMLGAPAPHTPATADASLWNNRATVALRRGDTDAARDLLTAAMAAAEAAGDSWRVAALTAERARIEDAAGRPEDARTLHDAAERGFRSAGDAAQADAEALRLARDTASRQPRKGREALGALLDAQGQTPTLSAEDQVRLRLSLADTLRGGEHSDAVYAHLGAAGELLFRMGRNDALADLGYLYGDLALRWGEVELAREAFDKLADLERDLGLEREPWRSQLGRARLSLARGEGAGAALELAAAADTLRRHFTGLPTGSPRRVPAAGEVDADPIVPPAWSTLHPLLTALLLDSGDPAAAVDRCLEGRALRRLQRLEARGDLRVEVPQLARVRDEIDVARDLLRRHSLQGGEQSPAERRAPVLTALDGLLLDERAALDALTSTNPRLLPVVDPTARPLQAALPRGAVAVVTCPLDEGDALFIVGDEAVRGRRFDAAGVVALADEMRSSLGYDTGGDKQAARRGQEAVTALQAALLGDDAGALRQASPLIWMPHGALAALPAPLALPWASRPPVTLFDAGQLTLPVASELRDDATWRPLWSGPEVQLPLPREPDPSGDLYARAQALIAATPSALATSDGVALRLTYTSATAAGPTAAGSAPLDQLAALLLAGPADALELPLWSSHGDRLVRAEQDKLRRAGIGPYDSYARTVTALREREANPVVWGGWIWVGMP